MQAELAVLKHRAARFNETTPRTAELERLERLNKRKERFAVTSPQPGAAFTDLDDAGSDAKKAHTHESAGTPADSNGGGGISETSAKLAARAARFGMPQ